MEDKEFDKKETSEIVEFIKELAISFVVIMMLFHFVVRPIQVKGRSMYPTLEDGAFGFSNTLGYKLNGLKRFDVVIIYLPEKKEYLVKRVIALPGETVSYQDSQLRINGQIIEEPFLNPVHKEKYGAQFTGNIPETKVPENSYYCLGDNRPNSSDSRVYGAFSKSQIISKGAFMVFPFSDFGVKSW